MQSTSLPAQPRSVMRSDSHGRTVGAYPEGLGCSEAMLLHAIMPASRANGPGLRSVVWFQGCRAMNCPGCWNPESHPFVGDEVWPNDVAERIIREAPAEVEGVTFSGGEPMQQAYHLLWLLSVLKMRRPAWTFGLFTGYTERELEMGSYEIHGSRVDESRKSRLWGRITRCLDFAVMGRYNRLQPCGDGLLSSRHQVLRLFGERYALDDFGQQLAEVQINEGGLVRVTGFPVRGALC